MNITFFKLGACALVGLATLVPEDGHAQEESPSLSDAIRGGDAQLSFNYRFEFVDQDNFERNAKASTLRTRLNYRTGEWRRFSAFLEIDDISEIGPDNFNGGAGTTPGREEFPVVADPANTHINQAYLDFFPHDSLRLRGGRQRIRFDNERFIGNVGWRQNEQTYDGVDADWVQGDWRLSYAYIFNVNRIFGNDVPAGDHDHNTHLARAAWSFAPEHSLALYYYGIDNEDDISASSNSFGLRYVGALSLGDEHELGLSAEYARQTDAADNPVDYHANYWHGTADFGFHSWLKLTAGYEVLSGDDLPGRAFRTPLATLHAFNGWADIFLNTPDDGLRDAYIKLTGEEGRFEWLVAWHDFNAEASSLDLGTELDASLNFQIWKNIALHLRVAFFDSDTERYPDTTKFWTMVTANF